MFYIARLKDLLLLFKSVLAFKKIYCLLWSPHYHVPYAHSELYRNADNHDTHIMHSLYDLWRFTWALPIYLQKGMFKDVLKESQNLERRCPAQKCWVSTCERSPGLMVTQMKSAPGCWAHTGVSQVLKGTCTFSWVTSGGSGGIVVLASAGGCKVLLFPSFTEITEAVHVWVWLSLKWSDFISRALCAESLLASVTKRGPTVNSGILPYHEPGPVGGQAAEWGAETIRNLLPSPPPLLLEVGWMAQAGWQKGVSLQRRREGRNKDLQGSSSRPLELGLQILLHRTPQNWLSEGRKVVSMQPDKLFFGAGGRREKEMICPQPFMEASGRTDTS